MRVYRWAILTSLAGLTVVLLGTAVYALQTPSPPPITYNELHKQTQREIPLRAPEQGADYLAIVADEPGFMTAVAPLLAYRENDGYQVTAVSLAQIADEFGKGEASAQAIQAFLTFAAESWQPAPQFVLLVGDATLDAQANATNQNLLPTYTQILTSGTHAASDSLLTTGEAAIAIGRFPVQTTDELTAVVNKTIAYETALSQFPDAAWLQRALLIADDKPYFDLASQQVENNLGNSGYYIHDLHMSQNPDIYTNIVAVLNRGVGILNYTGHGGKTSFADGTAFTADDVRLLQNEHRLPIFTAFSCQNGAFTDPQQDSVAEQLLLAENGGIVAAIGTSSYMETTSSLSLERAFYNHLLHGNATTLGDVWMETKAAVQEESILETDVYTYNLLGDPALHIHQPAPGQIVSPNLPNNDTLFVNDQ